jgi:hypothetical protein
MSAAVSGGSTNQFEASILVSDSSPGSWKKLSNFL